MKSFMALLATCACLVECVPPPHPDVEAVRWEEEQLHPLQRSPALRNPHLLQVLPLASLLHRGEKLVFAREAHDVSRKEIYKILTHAGLIPRKTYPVSHSHKHKILSFNFPHAYNEHDFYKLTYLQTQDKLQQL